jgi:c-di-GMP-binding flagellar brake protein YcgR
VNVLARAAFSGKLAALDLPLLQAHYTFLRTADRRTTWIFAAVAAGFVAVIVLGGLLARRRTRNLDPEHRRRFSRRVFHRTARGIGLSGHHIEILEHLVRVCGVQRPFLLFSSAGLLDDILRKGIYALYQDKKLKEEDRQRRLTHLFQIKQIIERSARQGIGARSTASLKAGQSLTITTEGGRSYPSRVVSAMRDLVACAAATDDSGAGIRWPRGTRLKINFWREGDAGYAFESKVLGYDTIKGSLCVLVHHARTLRREQQRKYRRSPLRRACFFYPVIVTGAEGGRGRRGRRRAVVQSARRLLGSVLDISAGGCSVHSVYALPANSLCKIEFELARRQHITVFGKVRSTRRTGIRGGIMHVMFTRLSSQYLNQIYLFVYDYAPPPILPARQKIWR